MVKTINLNSIQSQNAHLALHNKGYGNYYFIGDHNRERNLMGSALSMGPTDLVEYRQWLWGKINSEDSEIAKALRTVARSTYILHQECVEMAMLIAKAAQWYKHAQRVLMPQIVCTKCITYLTDENKGDFHMCAECAWSGNDEQRDWDVKDFLFYCSDCECILHNWYSKMYGQCQECREKESPQTFVGIYGTWCNRAHQKLDRILSQIPTHDLVLVSGVLSNADSITPMVKQYAYEAKITFMQMTPDQALSWATHMVIFWDGDYDVGQFLFSVQELEIPLRLIEF